MPKCEPLSLLGSIADTCRAFRTARLFVTHADKESGKMPYRMACYVGSWRVKRVKKKKRSSRSIHIDP